MIRIGDFVGLSGQLRAKEGYTGEIFYAEQRCRMHLPLACQACSGGEHVTTTRTMSHYDEGTLQQSIMPCT